MKPAAFERSLVADPAFSRLKEFIIQATGLHYFQDKDGDLSDRISKRLSAVSVNDCATYLEQLKSGTAGECELDELITELTIGETYFFRHTEQFDALRNIVLPQLIERNRDTRRLRIWSAGCSSGAEPYSIAILLREHFEHLIAGWDVKIIGTDINKDFLSRAQSGLFEEWAFRGTSPDIRSRCFSQSGKSWQIGREFRERVSFQYHNLITHPYPSALHNLFDFDLILCRNVVIYFSHDNFRELVARLERCLVPDGWLLVGHSEPHLEVFRSFRTISVPGAILYQRSETAAPPPTVFNLPPLPAMEWTHAVLAEPQLPPAPLAAVAEKSGGLDAVRGLMNSGDWPAAAKCCNDELSRDSISIDAHFLNALILEHLGQHADSEQALRKVIFLDRNFVLAHYYLALRLQNNHDHRGAIRSFENVLRLLATMDPSRVYADAEGMSGSDMQQFAQTHLEVLNRHA
jgi:chemotaxis protein methyltransferase CheR